MSSLAIKIDPRALKVWFDDVSMHVDLVDGREISVPLEWFPLLRDATDKQRKNYHLIGNGIGISWVDLDEDLSIAGLMQT